VNAYWSGPENSNNVVDVTGAGNSFLGGFAAGLILSHGDILEAVLHGSVSASYIIEQLGLPNMSHTINDSEELWNGDSPRDRLQKIRKQFHESANSTVQH